MRKLLPSPAMVVALLALSVAIGGTTYAAVQLKANSVGSKQLKTNAVKRPEVASGAVGTSELRAEAVRAAKLADDAVGGTKIQVGAVDTSKIADQTLLREDAVPGTLVTAYARINNPPGADNAGIVAASAVNVPDIDVINESAGNFIVTFNGLPGNSLETCTITAHPVLSPSTLGSLPKTTTMISTGGGSLSASSAQVQTLDFGGGGTSSDFYVQVSCPPG